MPNQYDTEPAFINCATCGKLKRIKQHQIGIAKFCSRACKNAGHPIKHGDARRGQQAPEYGIWCAMLERCSNPTNKEYPNYGGRGITVCDAWMEYKNFIRDVGRRPLPTDSIDRIDVNGNYEIDNVRWTTSTIQQRNRRYHNRLTVGDETRLLIEWSEIIGIPMGTLRNRQNLGWSPEQIIELELAPPRAKNTVTIDGATHTIPEWSNITGIPQDTIRHRLKRGLSGMQILEGRTTSPIGI